MDSIANSRLVSYFKLLSTAELTHLERFIQLPWLEPRKNCLELFRVLKSTAPRFSSPKLKKERLMKTFYPGTKSDSSLNVDMAKLLEIVQEFLVAKKLEERPVFKRHLLLEALLDREGEAHFQSVYDKTRKELKKTKQKDLDALQNDYLLESSLNRFQLQKKDPERSATKSLTDAYQRWFIAGFLRFSCGIITINKMLPEKHEVRMLRDVLAISEGEVFGREPLIVLYREVLQLLTAEDKLPHFTELKALLAKHQTAVTKEELANLYTPAVNFCMDQISAGKNEFIAQLFDLYKGRVESGLIYKHHHILPRTFHTIISVALKAGEFDWLLHFTETYCKDVVTEFQDSIRHFAVGAVHLYKGEFDAAYDSLLKIENAPDVYYEIDWRTMQLRAFYEKGAEEAYVFDNLCETFRSFIRRNNQVAPYLQEAHLNFLKMLRAVFKLKTTRPDRQAIDKLSKKLDELQHVSNKAWLQQKVEELIAKK